MKTKFDINDRVLIKEPQLEGTITKIIIDGLFEDSILYRIQIWDEDKNCLFFDCNSFELELLSKFEINKEL